MFDWLKRLAGQGKRASESSRPGVPPLIARVLEHVRDPGLFDEHAKRPGPAAEALGLPAEEALQLIRDMLPAYMWYREASNDHIERTGHLSSRDVAYWKYHAPLYELDGLLSRLLRRKLPVTGQDLERLLAVVLHARRNRGGGCRPPVSLVLGQVERFAQDNELPDVVTGRLEELRADTRRKTLVDAEEGKILIRIAELLAPRDRQPPSPIEPGEAWTEQALRDLETLAETERAAWWELLAHCARARPPKPSAKWQETAAGLVDAVGWDALLGAVERWFALVTFVDRGARIPLSTVQLVERHQLVLKGLAWCCAARDDARAAAALHVLAANTLKKIPDIGPWAVKVGNAALWALGAMPGLQGASRLVPLESRIKTPSLRNRIGQTWARAAEREGVSPADLVESTVPACGLTSVGLREEPVGEFTAVLHVADARRVELAWRGADGKERLAVPATVKEKHAAELRSLQATRREIRARLGPERQRLDALCRLERSWSLAQWRERFHDHPLVGTLARRLIWTFGQEGGAVAGLWSGGELVSARGEPIPRTLPEPVTLWHPLTATVGEVKAWRALLDSRAITQPFPQAHREIYVLTEAERVTGTYSNRFAGHILRQHQFHSLCEQRGWSQKLAGEFDSDPSATLALPAWGMRAEYWAERAGGPGEVGVSASGIHLHVATDQVRFYDLDAARDRPAPLERVPARLLSEVFRDVDLFVSVASVGNDPEWHDGGPGGGYGDYWRQFAFGELNASAKTRQEVLERLIPRLKIAPRCELRERFLVVRGSRRTYRIHLGSANVLMEPDDQHLCIVRAPTARAEEVMLPFEGDATLATVLSKAFLLADDARITDPSILSQIEGRLST